MSQDGEIYNSCEEYSFYLGPNLLSGYYLSKNSENGKMFCIFDTTEYNGQKEPI